MPKLVRANQPPARSAACIPRQPTTPHRVGACVHMCRAREFEGGRPAPTTLPSTSRCPRPGRPPSLPYFPCRLTSSYAAAASVGLSKTPRGICASDALDVSVADHRLDD